MRSVLTQLSVYMLLISGVRLGVLVKNGLDQVRSTTRVTDVSDFVGLLQGVDGRGEVVRARNSEPLSGAKAQYLLIFTIHSQSQSKDLDHWDEVIALNSARLAGSGVLLNYWGVCDKGNLCTGHTPVANFSMIGYLPPAAMRIIANADAKSQALLCDNSNRIVLRLSTALTPSKESAAIISQIKATKKS